MKRSIFIRSMNNKHSYTKIIPSCIANGPNLDVLVTHSDEDVTKWLITNKIWDINDKKEKIKDDKVILGFDVEWRPSFNKGASSNKVSLIQLCTLNSAILIQIMKMNQIPNSLKEVIQSSNIIKVGVGILDDLDKLEKDWNIPYRSGSFCDLGAVTRRIQNNSMAKCGLVSLAHKYLDTKMVTKPKKIQMSNWERIILSDAQITYATYDAYIGRAVYERLHIEGAFKEKIHGENVDRIFDNMFQFTLDQEAGFGRSDFRRIFNAAAESDSLMREVSYRIQFEDEKAISIRDAISINDVSRRGSSSIWRKALAMYISRLGWTLKFITKSSSNNIGIDIEIEGYIIASASGKNKGEAAESACRDLYVEFIQFQKQLEGKSLLLELFAGKVGLNASTIFNQFIERKVLFDNNFVSLNIPREIIYDSS